MFETEDGITIKGFSLRDVVGRQIRCDDGVTRKVEQISYSQKHMDRVLVNEINEDETPGGTWVHALSLGCQMNGSPIPTQEQMDAFSRVVKALRFQPEDESTPKSKYMLPSGLVVSRERH
jgi:hypothetical protein